MDHAVFFYFKELSYSASQLRHVRLAAYLLAQPYIIVIKLSAQTVFAPVFEARAALRYQSKLMKLFFLLRKYFAHYF